MATDANLQITTHDNNDDTATNNLESGSNGKSDSQPVIESKFTISQLTFCYQPLGKLSSTRDASDNSKYEQPFHED
ncbi:hypothetical protein VNO77_36477 [Canavalia gladiata]|uniref:Uncharacterized protein n=1 Tax=Canavalia gladiata TaxID=3824 RepID=A0AAN9PXS1_CANGL